MNCYCGRMRKINDPLSPHLDPASRDSFGGCSGQGKGRGQRAARGNDESRFGTMTPQGPGPRGPYHMRVEPLKCFCKAITSRPLERCSSRTEPRFIETEIPPARCRYLKINATDIIGESQRMHLAVTCQHPTVIDCVLCSFASAGCCAAARMHEKNGLDQCFKPPSQWGSPQAPQRGATDRYGVATRDKSQRGGRPR
jgi:hypothetical protein